METKTTNKQVKSNFDKIITSHDFPPISIRDYDWSAVRADYEPGDLIGSGRTEKDAIDDLLHQEMNAKK